MEFRGNENIFSITARMYRDVQENEEEFIFKTIMPFCEEVVQRTMSKKDLISALTLWRDYRWHDLKKDSTYLPPKNVVVRVAVRGSDIIRCKPGETMEEAIDRVMNGKVWYTEAQHTNDGWDTPEHQPFILKPIAWQYIQEFEG